MTNLNCLIIDDEELARVLLENYAAKIPFLNVKGQCKNPIEAITLLEQHNIDLLLLDIQMPELSGIEFLKTLKQKPYVIFTTAYANYALQGFELDVVDYLLKPFSFDRFLKAIYKVQELKTLQQKLPSPLVPSTETKRNYIAVKAGYKTYRIGLDDVLFIEGMREYVAYHTKSMGRILSLDSLKRLSKDLPNTHFLRVHKSYIVNKNYVKSLEQNSLSLQEKMIPVGASYRDIVLTQLF